MATIITPPAEYSSVKRSVIFGIDRDEDNVFDVIIEEYAKQMPAGSSSVNVAQYYRRYFNIWPLLDVFDDDAIFQVEYGADISRIIDARISVDSVVSDSVWLIDSEKAPVVNRFMSDIRRRIVVPGQVDEIPILSDEDDLIISYNDDEKLIAVPATICFVAFKVPDNAPKIFNIKLKNAEGDVLDVINYEIGSGCGDRLAWVNAYGAIDFWNFDSIRSITMKVTKEIAYFESGYTPTSIESDTTRIVASKALPEHTAEALSYLLKSSTAWRIDGSSAIPIDITSDSMMIFNSEKASAIEIGYRDKIIG